MNSDIPRDLARTEHAASNPLFILELLTYDDVKVDAPATGMFCQDDKPFIL